MLKLIKNLKVIRKNILVKDVMTKDVVTLDKKEPVLNAAKIMAERRISTVVITDNGELAGIVTERDMVSRVICKNIRTDKTMLQEIMTRKPITIAPDTSLLKASSIMKDRKIRKIVVVDNGRIAGIISSTDVVRSINRLYSTYESLLWNPYLYFLLFAGVLILFIINLLVFRR